MITEFAYEIQDQNLNIATLSLKAAFADFFSSYNTTHPELNCLKINNMDVISYSNQHKLLLKRSSYVEKVVYSHHKFYNYKNEEKPKAGVFILPQEENLAIRRVVIIEKKVPEPKKDYGYRNNYYDEEEEEEDLDSNHYEESGLDSKNFEFNRDKTLISYLNEYVELLSPNVKLELEITDPEGYTPLGIATGCGMNLIAINLEEFENYQGMVQPIRDLIDLATHLKLELKVDLRVGKEEYLNEKSYIKL